MAETHMLSLCIKGTKSLDTYQGSYQLLAQFLSKEVAVLIVPSQVQGVPL